MDKIHELGFSKLVALFLVLIMTLGFLSIFSVFSSAGAATVTNFSDTISDSATSTAANHTIQFTAQNPVDAGETIQLTFHASFTVPAALDYTDVDVTDDGAELALAASPSGPTWGIATSATNIVTLTSGTSTIASGSIVIFEIGTHATEGTVGDQQITNPGAVGSYTITIAGTFAGTGETRIAIIGPVVVTATVGTSLTCTVAGVATTQVVKNTTTTVSSTIYTIPFGTLSSGTPAIAAQDFSVSTNASNGFTVTIEQDTNLTNGSGDDIDCFDDGTCASASTSYAAWSSPAGTLGNEATYGHFGFTSEDATLETSCGNAAFGTQTANTWGGFSGTSTQEVMCHTGPVNGTGQGQGIVRLGFQAEISALQEAGDYTNTLTYICTPTF